jgi:hypothetical protein
MRFYRGEIYECETADGSRKAMVVDLADDGRKATLRPFNGGAEFTASWAEFCATGMWKRTEAKEATH